VANGDRVGHRWFKWMTFQGRLFVWAIRSYDSVEPIVFSVDEADEISIGDGSSRLILVLCWQPVMFYSDFGQQKCFGLGKLYILYLRVYSQPGQPLERFTYHAISSR